MTLTRFKYIILILTIEDLQNDQHWQVFIFQDVNDEIPIFKSPSYVAEISENAQKNTPVTFLGQNMIPEVFDHDQGTNGPFKLFLEGDDNIFDMTPTIEINDATFVIRVKDQN